MEDNRYLEIENYLQGELSEEEEILFEKKLKNDPEFASEVALYKEIEENLTSRFSNKSAETDLRNTLSIIGTQQSTSQKKPTKVIQLHRFRKLMVAASIAALIGLFVFNQGKPTFADFAKHQPIELTVRGTTDDALVKAEKAYNTKEYDKAIEYFDQVLTKQPKNIEIQLYKAISLLETDSFLEADTLLESISIEKTIFKDQATWYLALSKLKQDKLKICKKILMQLSGKSEYYNQAQQLLKQL